jgi:predicted small metal-binding protein
MVVKMPSFKCKNVGMDCPFEATAPNEWELEKKIAEHARSVHHMELGPKEWEEFKKTITC